MKKRHSKLVYLIFLAILVFILKVTDSPTHIEKTTHKNTSDNNLRVYYLNVGQGDSAFLQLPNGECMLIDAGTKDSGDKIVSTLNDMGIDNIDHLIATHPHTDHIGGMQKVVANFDIGTFYLPNASATTKTFENLINEIEESECEVVQAKAGVEILSDDNLYIEFVAPNTNEYEDLNNYSAVIKLTYGNNSFVFTGDAEKLSEDEIRANIKCDVLKIGHHGSSSSTSKNFLKKTEPDYAIISCGADNDYGHPHKEVLERLKDIKVYRTDLNGTVEAVSDGNKITFNVERE